MTHRIALGMIIYLNVFQQNVVVGVSRTLHPWAIRMKQA